MVESWQMAGIGINPHDVMVGLGLLAAVLVFTTEKRRRGMNDERLWAVVVFALAGGAVFARLGTWAQHLNPGDNAGLVEQWLYGNRSILSGLLGAYLGAHFGKRISGYHVRTGALFAPAVAAGMAIGRVGCLLTELPGTPTGAGWGIRLNAEQAGRLGTQPGVGLHPSFVYEIAFHLLALVLIWRWRDRLIEPAALFTAYLLGYAVFRFLVEFVRGNDVVWLGFTRPQLFLAITLPLLFWRTLATVKPMPQSPTPVEVAT